MSHFSVLVIGDNATAQLAPYHEFECTGDNDQYVQDVDQTEEVLKEFAEAQESMVRLADGTEISRYDDQCYREPTAAEIKKHRPMGTGCGGGLSWSSKEWGDGKGYRVKIHEIPQGAVEFERGTIETFADWFEGWHGHKTIPHGQQPDIEGEHKYGYALLDFDGKPAKVIRRTNPNAQWDWWQVGGRWSGFLKLKEGAVGEVGKKGLMGSCRNDDLNHCDITRKQDIDFEGMRAKAAAEAAVKWDAAHAIHQGVRWDSWKAVRESTPAIDEAREKYHQQAMVKLLHEVLKRAPFEGVDEYLTPREAYVQQAADCACVTFAVVKDGKWFQKGEMGWWGAVSDAKQQGDWNREFNTLLDDLPGDTVLTVVDCHI